MVFVQRNCSFPCVPCGDFVRCFAAGHIAAGNVGIVVCDIATIFIGNIIHTVVYRKSVNCLICDISHILYA